MKWTVSVRIWEIADRSKRKSKQGKGRAASKGRPYGVRWFTDGKEHSEWYAGKAHANSRRLALMQAARRGERFEVAGGLPESEMKQRNALSLLEFAQKYMDMKWADAAAKSRASTVEALAAAVTTHVADIAGRPDLGELRRALTRYVLPPTTRDSPRSDDEQKLIDWIVRQSRPLVELADVVAARDILDALALKLDGKTGAASVYRRKRAVVYNLLEYAVERELLDINPFTKVKKVAPKLSDEVDPRVVANPATVRRMLVAVTYVGNRDPERGAKLVAFFATCYYAAARPAEVLALRRDDCVLPDTGFGELLLGISRPAAGKRWTDSGEVHDRRGLKHRAADDVRPVPVPPVLVGILRDHLGRFGTAKDGRLFQSPNGGVVSSSTYSRIWEDARAVALTPVDRKSPKLGRPYDLRHAAVSLWLNRSVPAPEVAERAGHSVDVLLRVYAKCLEGDREKINRYVLAAFDE
jgi:integrase